MRKRRACLAVIFCAACGAAQRPATDPESTFDIVIANGRIIDGTGKPAFAADVGIRAGYVAKVGALAGAARTRTIDATGLVVTPGFIDMLGQSDLSILVDPRLPSKIHQGITTEVTGEGMSVAPQNDAVIASDMPYYEHLGLGAPKWRTLGEYFAQLEKNGIGINVASYVGATQVRRVVLGDGDKQPTPAELETMKRHVVQGMRDGAVGVSSSLMYPPAPYAKTEELIALANEASKLGGIYATHMRSESSAVLEALDETFRVGKEASVAIEIFHLKVAGTKNWGRMPEVVARIERARKDGIDVGADTYAYPAWQNAASAFVPPWAHDGGDDKLVERLRDLATRARIRTDMLTPTTAWDNEWQSIPGPEAVLVSVVLAPELLPLQGKRLPEIAAMWKEEPIDALLDLLIKDRGHTTVAVFGMDEKDVALALRQPWMSIDCDAAGASPEGVLGREHPHPRAYGTFPRILRKYVREEHAFTLEEAIAKFTGRAAARVRFHDHGILKPGWYADVAIFDPSTITDRATFEQPNQLSEGMRWVLVNGVPVIDDGKMTGALPGKVIRGSGYPR
jgi:dihydroorotase/N-acyl-D-amino-acid deacylase